MGLLGEEISRFNRTPFGARKYTPACGISVSLDPLFLFSFHCPLYQFYLSTAAVLFIREGSSTIINSSIVVNLKVQVHYMMISIVAPPPTTVQTHKPLDFSIQYQQVSGS